MPATTNGYLVRRVADAPTVPCPCGESTRPLTAADGAPCSVHVTAIRDSARHYHRETTEVYYILDGRGKMELNGDWVELEPGTAGQPGRGEGDRVQPPRLPHRRRALRLSC